MCLNYLNEQFKAYDDLKKRIGKLSLTQKIISVVAVCLMPFLFLLWHCYINPAWPFDLQSGRSTQGNENTDVNRLPHDDFQKNYNKKVAKFREHLSQAKRNRNGVNELEFALNILKEIKELEASTGMYIEETMQLTKDFKEKCEELMLHFNKMRFCDYEDVKQDGEQLYDSVKDIKKKL